MIVTDQATLEGLRKPELLGAAIRLAERVRELSADVYVMYMGTGGIPGGAVHVGWMQCNPCEVALKVPHKRIDKATYESCPLRQVNW